VRTIPQATRQSTSCCNVTAPVRKASAILCLTHEGRTECTSHSRSSRRASFGGGRVAIAGGGSLTR
jgi:hypothetical protein